MDDVRQERVCVDRTAFVTARRPRGSREPDFLDPAAEFGGGRMLSITLMAKQMSVSATFATVFGRLSGG